MLAACFRFQFGLQGSGNPVVQELFGLFCGSCIPRNVGNPPASDMPSPRQVDFEDSPNRAVCFSLNLAGRFNSREAAPYQWKFDFSDGGVVIIKGLGGTDGQYVGMNIDYYILDMRN